MRQTPQNEADVLDEPQIEHAVRLIQDRHLNVAQFEHMLLEVVDDAPGCADEHVDALFQDAPLLLVIDPAEDDGEFETGVFGDDLRIRVNLHREFSRRRDDDGARRVDGPIGRPRIRQQTVEEGDQKRRRLAGAGLRLTRHVVACERQGQGLRLNRGATGETEFGDTPLYGFGDMERIERELTEMGV